jgi:outer membrane lipoprotein-sorting protein
MSGMKRLVKMLVVVVAVMVAGWIPAMGGSAAIGSLAGSRNTTLSGQEAMANTTVFSGDSLHVRDGVAVVALGQGSRMVFGRETEASFLKEGDGVTVLLGNGNVSMYEPETGSAVRVKAGDVAVEPAAGYKTLGEVAMVNGAVQVTAKEGMLKVEGQDGVKEVAAGKTLTVAAKTARAPMPAPAVGTIPTATALQIGALGASGVGAVLSGVAISRAGSARDAADAANTTAAEAVSAATAANAQAAFSAATAAQSTANSVGCAVNTVANSNGEASPYTPPSGSSCP